MDFIKSLILLSTPLKAEKPLMRGPEGKPSAETEKANSTAQPDILRAKPVVSTPGELLPTTSYTESFPWPSWKGGKPSSARV